VAALTEREWVQSQKATATAVFNKKKGTLLECLQSI
jgi:hypothetical protein